MASYCGLPWDVILQGFHWRSFDAVGNRKLWYEVIRECVPQIKAAGFTWVWFPPPSDSLAPEGYMPRRWYDFHSRYGSEAELRAALNALAPEVRALADVVVNHRVGMNGLTDFVDPSFGTTPEDNLRAIVKDDNRVRGRGRRDTGEDEGSSRDLDHTQPYVRERIIEYLRKLLDLGFRGWRYDFVKGYHGNFVRGFNEQTLAEGELAIGEYFDGDTGKLLQWLQEAGTSCTVFDYPLRFALLHAIRRDDFTGLRWQEQGTERLPGVLGHFPGHAVTFLDNHDTEYRRGANEHFYGVDVSVGYAFLLTHPGIPCVFWSHFFDWDEATRQAISKLLELRQASRLTSTSTVRVLEARPQLYAAIVDDRVAVKLGSDLSWNPGHGWSLEVSGDRFAVWQKH